MTDLPPGDWSPLLVGHQWPTSASLQTIATASTNRLSTGCELESYAEQLASANSGTLASQVGVTAEDTRMSFRRGESLARELATKNLEKRLAYESARTHITELRSELSAIAASGNSEIDRIQSSTEAIGFKLAKVVEVVVASQTDANAKAAKHADSVLDSIQRMLTTDDNDASAREFAKASGAQLDREFSSPNRDLIADAVKARIERSADPTASSGSASDNSNSLHNMLGNAQTPTNAPEPNQAAALGSQQVFTNARTPESRQIPVSGDNASAAGLPSGAFNNADGPLATTGSTTTSPIGPAPSLSGSVSSTTTDPTSVTASLQHSVGSTMAPASAANIPTPTPALSPEGLANNFNSGLHAGAPVSTGAEALSNNAVHAVQAQAPVHSQPVHPAQMAPTAGTPIFETSHAAHTPVDTAVPTPPADAPQTVIAAAPPPAVPTGPAPPAAAPAGPLPAYGADLRPAAAAPAGPPPAPMTAPGSAPVNPTATALNQPAVVRQQPVATPQNAPAGLTENAVAATAAGAAAGAGAAHTQARHRLQRLLDFVARQEPKLRWAIGDREDGSTVLVTDLAGGWVPPHVRIPVGATLLAPGRRTGPPTTLLGPTRLTATYSPGQYIAPDDAEPVRTSIRARQTADVEELGWELSRATKWRDGLPRLAHTLAKAASSGSGYLDSEIDLLNAHLQAITSRVLGEYPDNHDPATVGNWQLLASIGALINNERICANYHLAWFQAMSLAPTGEAQR